MNVPVWPAYGCVGPVRRTVAEMDGDWLVFETVIDGYHAAVLVPALDGVPDVMHHREAIRAFAVLESRPPTERPR